jgi:hypothetical protein
MREVYAGAGKIPQIKLDVVIAGRSPKKAFLRLMAMEISRYS